MEFLFLMKIFGAQISLKLQNIVLNEQSQINVEFHDSMKNIAKLIETQYELNYIVPLIGEMLDRFISDHLIYVFLKQDDEFKLVWPKACNDERVFEAIKQLDNDYNYILTNDDKIGAFPLLSVSSTDNEIIGCIVARSMIEKLSKRDIDYLEQLTRQAAATINRANTYSTILQYATLDALTNLNNRRQFETRLGQEIAIAKRQNNPLCAMMIDIDFFKRVNDTYGHAAGDEVLRTVAGLIKAALRESDIPARYGGEEFAILLPYSHLKEAKTVGERIRKAVENHPIPIEIEGEKHDPINVTISMGLAEFDFKESGEELFERADKALYEAKTSGRNRVCIN
jgi:diguanylate cyclase (GGDEF)-like protein